MPNVGLGADIGHIRDWLYNSGNYGRNPSVGDMIEKGWLPLLATGLVYYDPTNKDVRYRDPMGGYYPVTAKTYTFHLAYMAFVIATTDDTYISITGAIITYLQDASREGASFAIGDLADWAVEFISCYQNSGGALGVFVAQGPPAGENVINYKASIASGVITDLQDRRWIFPLYDPADATSIISWKWSAAAGAADKVMVQLWKKELI